MMLKAFYGFRASARPPVLAGRSRFPRTTAPSSAPACDGDVGAARPVCDCVRRACLYAMPSVRLYEDTCAPLHEVKGTTMPCAAASLAILLNVSSRRIVPIKVLAFEEKLLPSSLLQDEELLNGPASLERGAALLLKLDVEA